MQTHPLDYRLRSFKDFFLCVDRFVCKNTGVLFETDILQVGIKSEFKEGKGKSLGSVLHS